MPHRRWDERYENAQVPWDTGVPEPHLVELVEEGAVRPGRVLEIGCGTGTNAIWLAEQGFTVHAVDISPRAIELAEQKRRSAGASVRLTTANFLVDEIGDDAFDFVFDRGVFHVFDEPDDRTQFAKHVARLLAPSGLWVSLIGSTEGPPRDHGPPRRSAGDIVAAVEPVLEVLTLHATGFHGDIPSPAKAWLMMAQAREVPAQPSTRRG
jgi:ubiquinone/menaquinone biosynthesis C-methylase UbiE